MAMINAAMMLRLTKPPLVVKAAKALEEQAAKFWRALGNLGVGVAMTLLPRSSARAGSGVAGSAVPKP